MRNTMLRIASVLLVAVMLTTALVGGVFAKYITADSTTGDSASVAKWGVTVTVTGDDAAFDTTYAAKAGADYAEDIANTVVSSSTTELVAPGTGKDNVASIAITGTPEVAVNVTKTATLTLTGWTIPAPTQDAPDATAFYCPIVIEVNDEAISGLDYTSADLFKDAVEAAITESNGNFAANTNLANTHDIVVDWSWAFEGNDDAKDTALGNLATAPTIELVMGATVTQLD